MKSLFEKEPIPTKPKNEEEALLDELDFETKELIDTVKRQQKQLEDSVKLVNNINQRVETKTNQVADLNDRVDIEASRSSVCTFF